MGDGGCIVLSSRLLVVDFSNSKPRFKQQLKARHGWTAEFASAGGRGSRSPLALCDVQNLKLPSTTFNDMQIDIMEDGTKHDGKHVYQQEKSSEHSPHCGDDENDDEVDKKSARKPPVRFQEVGKLDKKYACIFSKGSTECGNLPQALNRYAQEESPTHNTSQFRRRSIKDDIDFARKEQEKVVTAGFAANTGRLGAHECPQGEDVDVSHNNVKTSKSLASVIMQPNATDITEDCPGHREKSGRTSKTAACCDSKEAEFAKSDKNENEKFYERTRHRKERGSGFSHHTNNWNPKAESGKEQEISQLAEGSYTSRDCHESKCERKEQKAFDSRRHMRRGHGSVERSSDSHSSRDRHHHGDRQRHDSHCSKDEHRYQENDNHSNRDKRRGEARERLRKDEFHHEEKNTNDSCSSKDEHQHQVRDSHLGRASRDEYYHEERKVPDTHSNRDEYHRGVRELHDRYMSRATRDDHHREEKELSDGDEHHHEMRKLHDRHLNRDEHRHGDREFYKSRDDYRYYSRRNSKVQEKLHENRPTSKLDCKHRLVTDKNMGKRDFSCSTHNGNRGNVETSCYNSHGRDSHKSSLDLQEHQIKGDDRHSRRDNNRTGLMKCDINSNLVKGDRIVETVQSDKNSEAIKGDKSLEAGKGNKILETGCIEAFKSDKNLEAELESQSAACVVGEEYAFPPSIANDDDSHSIEMDVPMDLSPAPAEDSLGRSSEVMWIEAGNLDLTVQFNPEYVNFSDSVRGWVYVDYEGNFQGPVDLSTLRKLWGEGKLQLDHMVMLEGSNMWVTLEHAGMTTDRTLRSGHKVETGGVIQASSLSVYAQETSSEHQQEPFNKFNDISLMHGCNDIDRRIEKLMHGFTLMPGQEKEIIAEALMNSARKIYQDYGEGYDGSIDFVQDLSVRWTEAHDLECNEYIRSGDASYQTGASSFQSPFQGSRKWTAGGGDWKLVCQLDNPGLPKGLTNLEKPFKMVLNRGIPLCEGPPCKLPDPRKACQEPTFHEVSQWRYLELPPFAYRFWDAQSQAINSRLESSQWSPPKSDMAIQKSQVASSFCSDSILKDGTEWAKKYNDTNDELVDKPRSSSKSSRVLEEDEAKNGQVSYRPLKEESQLYPSTSLSHHEVNGLTDELADRNDSAHDHCFKTLPSKEDLRLNEGQWFYRNGAGHEVGPFLYGQLQREVQDGLLCEGTSIYRKHDETWVSVSLDDHASQSSDVDKEMQAVSNMHEPGLFHKRYPQFMGYMCGELHQHLMKSYRTRDFPAMLWEGLDKWLQTRSMVETVIQTENVSLQFSTGSSDVKVEKFRERDISDLSSPVISGQGSCSVRSSDFSKDGRVGRIRSLHDVDDTKPGCQSEVSMLELYMESKENAEEGWENLEPDLLIRVLGFLESDIRALIVASATCKAWRLAMLKLKRDVKQIDLSCLGRLCSDTLFMSYTERAFNVSQIILRGCSNLSLPTVRTFLEQHDSLTVVDVCGCSQLKELIDMFPHVSWVTESHWKLKGWKNFAERGSSSISIFKYYNGVEEGIYTKGRAVLQLEGVIDSMDMEICRTPNDVKRMKVNSSGKYSKFDLDGKTVAKDSTVVGGVASDKDHIESKQKQKLTSAGSSTAQVSASSIVTLEKYTKIEKDMAHVLHTICQFLDGRSSELLKIEDKLRRGLYQGINSGFAKFKDDLFTVCRKLLRGNKQELVAGREIFKITFRLMTQLEQAIKARGHDILNPDYFKRKYQDQDSRFLITGRKREILGDSVKKQGLAKRRRGLDACFADEVWETESSCTDEEGNLYHVKDEDETDASDFEAESDSELVGEYGQQEADFDEKEKHDLDGRYWGARMTKAAMVPPVTRKYQLIEEYVIVADNAEVIKRMNVKLPKDYGKRWQEVQGIEYSHLELPDLREFQPRKRVQDEVVEQEVYGIDPYTHNLLMDSLPFGRLDFPDERRHQFIEEDLLKALNQEARRFTGTGKAPTTYPLECVVERIVHESKDPSTRSFASGLLRNIRSRQKDKYVAYRKGLGVVCNHKAGFNKDEFVVEFFGEVYPTWRWFEKQDAIRLLQKKDDDPAPEFYNIFLERPKGDASGYDLVVVDAMHKANYASRICHACRPNCEARVAAVDGRYQIGVYTLRSIEYGEELTFDYNSITESKEEYEKSICLCGSQGCRGSYLHLAGPDTFQEIMRKFHGLLHRYDLLLRACTDCSLRDQDWSDLRQAGLGSCLLDGLPDWTIRYAAAVVRFMNRERKYLPKEILKNITKERRLESFSESEALEAEIQADGVFNGRLQNLAITLDKVKYVFKKLYLNPRKAPPPLKRIEPHEAVSFIWTSDSSVVSQLLDALSLHCSREEMVQLRRKVGEHEPSLTGNIEKNMRQSLLWLRDELCGIPSGPLCRHDAAADLIHMYAHTKFFFTSQDYPVVKSPPITISPLDLGPKHAHLLGSASHEWTKTYCRDYVLGQLIFWYRHNSADPGTSLLKLQRGCLVLPDPSSCYAKPSQPRLVYGNLHRTKLLRIMEQNPQRPWTWKGQLFWEFRNNDQTIFGSPMMDSICQKMGVSKEMLDWLKRRRTFEGPWDNY